jgi:transposase
MSKRTYQRYSSEFKEKALGLLSLGKPVAEVAEDLQITSNLLYTWRNQAKSSQGGSAGPNAEGVQSEADALRALRREVALLRSENDILKKAAIILGTSPLRSSAK